MKLFTVLLATIVRKVKIVIAEYNKLISEAKDAEKNIISTVESRTADVLEAAKSEEKNLLLKASMIIGNAKAYERKLLYEAGAETRKVYDEVVNKLSNL